MSLFTRSPRRAITTFAAIGALAAAAIVAPSLAASASASDTSTAKSLLSDVNTQRASNSVVALKADGYLIPATQKLAKSYAGSGHPCPTSDISAPNDADGDSSIVNAVLCVRVSVGSNEASRLTTSFFALPDPDDSLYNPFAGYVGLGVYTSGSHVYAVLSLVGYNNPANQEISFGKPTIKGTAKVGHLLIADFPTAILDDGFSTGNPLYTTDWVANGLPVATNTELYTVQPADAHKHIVAIVVVSKSGFGTVTSDSSATAKVLPGTFTFSNSKTSIVQSGMGITFYEVEADPATTADFQWYVGRTPVDSANGGTSYIYYPNEGDIGHRLTEKVTFVSDGYTTVTRTYETAKHWAGLHFISDPAPVIGGYAGEPAVGDTITSTIGTWNPTASFDNKWEVNGTTVAKNTTELLVKSSWVGKKITVVYVGSDAGSAYVSTSRSSAATPKVIS